MKFDNLGNLSILYIEDDDEIRQITSIVLEDYVGKLHLARNGEEGLKIFNQYKIDIVLTDVLMPKMTGIELAYKIREGNINPQTPIIITTAFIETQYLMEAIKLKCDGYILKPIDIEDLLATIQKTIKLKLQVREIEYKNLLLNVITTFVSGKKIEIIKFLINKLDKNFIFYGGYQDIIDSLNVSKPTIVKTFKQLMDVGLLVKIKNKVYKLHSDFQSLEFKDKIRWI